MRSMQKGSVLSDLFPLQKYVAIYSLDTKNDFHIYFLFIIFRSFIEIAMNELRTRFIVSFFKQLCFGLVGLCWQRQLMEIPIYKVEAVRWENNREHWEY